MKLWNLYADFPKHALKYTHDYFTLFNPCFLKITVVLSSVHTLLETLLHPSPSLAIPHTPPSLAAVPHSPSIPQLEFKFIIGN